MDSGGWARVFCISLGRPPTHIHSAMTKGAWHFRLYLMLAQSTAMLHFASLRLG